MEELKEEVQEKTTEAVNEGADIAIEVKNLRIGYKNIQAYSIKKSLLKLKKAHVEEFQAVKDVSFSVTKGEILGIIGKNGSGKSTMLKALAGIFCPDSGSIDLKGHTVSLLSIGVGFQNEVTGRENILLSGMLLGFSEEQIREKMPEIIEFAELGKFIDMPVKTYSSGMHSKLAFSITAILETEIMLVDEVLSVGDAKFKKKSFRKMKELISNKDRTVVIVSHNEDTLQSLCDRVMWMHEGEIKRIGNPAEVLAEYQEFMK
ncbi:MAG: ABC transporter ATP-binding protein [Clostridium sp.]|nr:ABC transporter ATP-binding protein [Clostridium sp.]